MTNDRRYDDREVGLILKRVAELHEREGEKTETRTLTKVEIEVLGDGCKIVRALPPETQGEVSSIR